MGDVYNTTTVEFQNYGVSGASRERGLGRGLLKYGLPILGGLSIGIGAVVAFAAFLSQESPSWLLLGLAILLLILGLALVTLWRVWSWKGRGFTVLKPRPRLPKDIHGHAEAEDVAAREEEFVNQDGLCDEIELPPTPTPSPEQSHYKPRHFAGHGYGRKPFAPLARAEEITPSLRSSRSSLAYIKEYDSESSISIDSSLFNMLR